MDTSLQFLGVANGAITCVQMPQPVRFGFHTTEIALLRCLKSTLPDPTQQKQNTQEGFCHHTTNVFDHDAAVEDAR